MSVDPTVTNQSVEDTIWTVDGLTYTEIIKQAYQNCVFSAGYVDGHPVDTLYLRFERGDDDRIILLRPDEAQALNWCLTGVLWSVEMGKLIESDR